MFGRHGRQRRGGDEVAVAATLELDLGAAEESVAAYLSDPTPALRNQLLAALETLDQRIDQSDTYEGSVIGSAAVGASTKGSVIGETSSASAAEEIPSAELRAQAILIKAAKHEVAGPTPETLSELRAAGAALAALRGQAPAS